MAHSSVTVIIPVRENWDLARVSLETLRPTLGVHDQVIVVVNGNDERIVPGLKRYSWANVVDTGTETSTSEALNLGAAAATGDTLIFLNASTVLPGRWIDGLNAALNATDVVVAGPRTNVPGPQGTPQVQYSADKMSELRKWARQWREQNRGQVTVVDGLDDVCVAVRREDFEAADGFTAGVEDFGADICRRLGERGTIVVADESFVHFQAEAASGAGRAMGITTRYSGQAAGAGKGVPLVSACMIIKDEIDNLSRCLTSLNGVVDEVVIYDTGSTDGSIELARAAGATVIEGYWDKDFGRARNAALEACRGEWILHIDADETFEGNPLAFRQFLASVDLPVLLVDILNLSEGNRHDLVHRGCRLFRREEHHWVGRLHEQVVPRDGRPRKEIGIAQNIRLKHYGYLPEFVAAKNKVERNLDLATLDADSDNGRDEMDKLTNLARSLSMAGKFAEAQDVLDRARLLSTGSEVVQRMMLRTGAQGAISLNRPEEALGWIEELQMMDGSNDVCRYLRGIVYSQLCEWERCLQEFDGLVEIRDADLVLPMFPVHVHRASSLASTGRWAEAADEISLVVNDEAHSEAIWALVVDSYWHAGRSLDALFDTIPVQHLNAVFAQLINAQPEAADIALEALWRQLDRRPNVLALSARVAPRLAVERALDWSARLREVGMAEECPLVPIAYDSTRPALDRLRAAAVVQEGFQDDRGTAALRSLAGSISEDLFQDALTNLDELAPSLLETFVVSAASSAQRSVALGKALFELGADSEGIAVVLHGIEQGADAEIAEGAASWLESVGRQVEAAAVRSNAPLA